MAAGIRYSITLTRNAERHVAISRYIEQHCIHDGRGIRLQPLIEKLFYEFARSGLSPDEICDAIRAYEANMAHKAGQESVGRLRESAQSNAAKCSSDVPHSVAEAAEWPHENVLDGGQRNAQESVRTTGRDDKEGANPPNENRTRKLADSIHNPKPRGG